MIVTALEEISKKRIKVYLDEEFAFVLYPQDLKMYHIAMNTELNEEILLQIEKEVLLRRGKKKSLQLLLKSNYTEYDLRKKLKQDFYPAHIIEEIVTYLYGYHYLDDMRYVEQYILSKMYDSSKAEMRYKLVQKGIKESLFEQVYDALEITDYVPLENLMKKKLYGREQITQKEKDKLFAFFLRKGYGCSDIMEAFAGQTQLVILHNKSLD